MLVLRVFIGFWGIFVKVFKDGLFLYSMVFFNVIYSNMCDFDNISSSNDILEDAQATSNYVCGYNCGHQHIGIVQHKWIGVGCQPIGQLRCSTQI